MAQVYRDAGIEAAKIAGESSVMDGVARAIAARARANALARGDSTFASSIEVRKVRGRRGVSDREIVATDPLAVPKELGHVIRNQADGPVLGYVKPMRYMRDALEQTPTVNGD